MSYESPSLIASSVFHYEFELIHPFSDGNGRMGRLQQVEKITRVGSDKTDRWEIYL